MEGAGRRARGNLGATDVEAAVTSKSIPRAKCKRLARGPKLGPHHQSRLDQIALRP